MLIAMICLAEACLSYNALFQVLDPVYISCYFGLEKLLAYTTKFTGNVIVKTATNVTQFQCSLNTLCYSNSIFFQGF